VRSRHLVAPLLIAAWAGIFLTSALFASLHFLDVYNVPGIFLMGLVLAWLCRRTGSVLPAIVAHAINNGTALAMLLR